MTLLRLEESSDIKKLVRNCLLFSIVMHLITAWFSVGYHMHDEHFSIFEFAGYKLGLTPASSLSWEFPAKIRQAIQPAIVVAIMKAMGPHANPFVCSFLVRLLAAILGFCSLTMMMVIGLQWLKNDTSKRFFILCTTFLWFFPYQHVRFSAENMSGSFFFLGLGCIWLGKDRVKNLLLVLGGFCIGLAFVFRAQTAFMIFGMVVWCIFVARFSFKKLLIIGFPALIAIAIGVILDYWFYGEWLSTAWNYYKVNLVQGRAATFGVEPWWRYFDWMTLDLIPPFSVICILGFLYAFYKYPKNIVSLSAIPFLLAHIIISHKEARFLFPLINGLPILLALAYEQTAPKIKTNKIFEISFKVFLGANILLMVVSGFKPASDQFGLYQYMYDHYNGKSAWLLNKEKQPYHLVDFDLYFHKPKDIHLVENVNPARADSFVNVSKEPVLILFTRQDDANNFLKSHPGLEPVYSNIPKWMYNFNINNWISRTRIWVLFELKR